VQRAGRGESWYICTVRNLASAILGRLSVLGIGVQRNPFGSSPRANREAYMALYSESKELSFPDVDEIERGMVSTDCGSIMLRCIRKWS